VDLTLPATRDALFAEGRDVHARAQGGGSGIDVAAAVHGGVLRYTLAPPLVRIDAVTLPVGLVLRVFFSGQSARTSDLVGRVAALRARDEGAHARAFAPLLAAAHACAAPCTLQAFVAEAAGFERALRALADAAAAPIVPPAFRTLADIASASGAAFLPAGAGGGDVGVFFGAEQPSPAFSAAARACGMAEVALAVETRGVHVCATRR
jgi:phosphomevalonate kinase